MTKVIGFISSIERLPEFKVAYKSIIKHESNTKIYLLLCSDNCDNIDISQEVTVIFYNKPIDCIARVYLLDYLLNCVYEKIIILDNDMELFAPVTLVWDKLDTYNAVVTPHITVPLPPDGLHPSMEDMVRAGNYNAGFFACKNNQQVKTWVLWWLKETTRTPWFNHPLCHFQEQGWLRFICDLLDNVYILKHPGINAAYWRLHYLDMKDIILYHYSGLVDASKISQHQNRWIPSDEYKEFLQSWLDRVKLYK